MSRQQGLAFTELVVVALITMLATIWVSQLMVNSLNDAQARTSAYWMVGLRNATHKYLTKYGLEIKMAATTSDLYSKGYVDWSEPEFLELVQDNLLSPGYPLSNALIKEAKVTILREGDCPGEMCQLSAVVYSSEPVLNKQGVVDSNSIAQWLIAADGKGGFVRPGRHTELSGATFKFNNPLNNGKHLPSGTVALAVTHEDLYNDWLVVGDHRDPMFNNSVSVGGGMNVQSDLSLNGELALNKVAQQHNSCTRVGSFARDNNGNLLSCNQGVWSAVGRTPGGYSINSVYGCKGYDGRSTANPVTGSCSCPIGALPVKVSEGMAGVASNGVTVGYICVN